MTRETERIYNTALKAARRAGAYLLARFESDDRVVKASDKHDVKLDVDSEAENLIIDTIRKTFPHHGFICEEGGSLPEGGSFPEGGSPPEGGNGQKAAGNNWIIDPLDGTVNFAWGIPHFCTSIAFKRGETLFAGAVYDPIRRELFSAFRGAGNGSGAFFNERPIKIREITDLGDAVVAGGFFKTGALDEGTRIFQRLSKKVLKIRFLGSAALDFCYLACGRVNAYVQHSVHEWDIAAALLIAEITGKRYEIERNEQGGTMNVLAADPSIFDELKAMITKK